MSPRCLPGLAQLFIRAHLLTQEERGTYPMRVGVSPLQGHTDPKQELSEVGLPLPRPTLRVLPKEPLCRQRPRGSPEGLREPARPQRGQGLRVLSWDPLFLLWLPAWASLVGRKPCPKSAQILALLPTHRET